MDVIESKNLVEISVFYIDVAIPIDFQQNLFEMVTKSSSKGTSQESGASLGLILCKYFIKIDKGKVWVESKLGKGSAFKFTTHLYDKSKVQFIKK